MPAWLSPILAQLKKFALASVGFILAEAAAYLHLATIGLIIATVVFAGVLIVIAVKVGTVFALVAAVVIFFLWGLLNAHATVASAAKLNLMRFPPPESTDPSH